MPLPTRLLLLTQGIQFRRLVYLFKLLTRNRGDLGITATQLAFGVENRMDMQSRCLWFSGQLSKPLYEGFLEIAGKVVLCPEEHDTTLGDCPMLDLEGQLCGTAPLLLIAKSLIKSSALGELIHSTRFAVGYSVPITGVTSIDSKPSRLPKDFNGSR